MEEALRNSEQKLREYKIKEANYLEAIEKYVRDLNEMKGKIALIKLYENEPCCPMCRSQFLRSRHYFIFLSKKLPDQSPAFEKQNCFI